MYFTVTDRRGVHPPATVRADSEVGAALDGLAAMLGRPPEQVDSTTLVQALRDLQVTPEIPELQPVEDTPW